MRISSGAKALFLIANHILATHLPPDTVLLGRVFGHPQHDGGLKTSLVTRASQKNFWKGCCIESCPQNQIIDTKDCSKCSDCPKGEKPNKNQDKCVKDNKEDKEKKFKEKLKKRFQEYKKKGYQKWKEIKAKEYNNKIENDKRNKVRRMVRPPTH